MDDKETKLNQLITVISKYVDNDKNDIKNAIMDWFCPKGMIIDSKECAMKHPDCEKCWNRGINE